MSNAREANAEPYLFLRGRKVSWEHGGDAQRRANDDRIGGSECVASFENVEMGK
jgi:CRISPR/Cas system-associated protein Cas5 (RAMP superfamily)